MDEKPITTLGPWSYHNPIDMAADEQSFSINKEVKWMNEIDKKIEVAEKKSNELWHIIAHYDLDEDDAIDVMKETARQAICVIDRLIDQLKECREEKNKHNYLFSDIDEALVIQRTKETCFKAGWAWIQNDFGEQFGYDPTDDTDKEDFKQALYEAKIDNNQRK